MSHTVLVQPTGLKIIVNEGETVLAAALRQGVVLAYNCRNGVCGTCKGKVIQGAVSYEADELRGISKEEQDRGLALFCQAIPIADLEIEAHTVDALCDIQIRMVPCRVQQMTRLADDVMRLFLKLPENNGLRFVPGQYINILLRQGGERSFSLAGSPGQDTLLELHIRHVSGGQFTDHVFTEMKVQDMLRFRGPLGTFVFRDDLVGPVIFMAGGTGFAPIKSILEDLFARAIDRPIFFYWGVRAKKDLYHHELVSNWVKQYRNFQYIPVLSEPRAGDHWSGRTGWVHEAVLADHPDLSNFSVYASGPPPMINAAKLGFLAQGLENSRLFYDSFEYAHDTETPFNASA